MSDADTLSAADASLLSQDLPVLREVALPGSSGALIEYREAGPQDAPAVVLLHGIGSSSAGYRAQFAGLSDRFRVIAWNAPGFGNSTPLPEADPTALDYAAALAAFLDALGLARIAVLVGSSWGSVIAVNLAVTEPGRAGALLLSAPNAARGTLTGPQRETELAAMRRAGHPEGEVDRSAVADRLLTPDTPRQVRALVERLRDAVTSAGWDAAVHMTLTTDTPSLIGRVACPVALAVGTRDKVAPFEQHAAKLLAAKPDAVLHRMEGFGHMLKLEAPTRFNGMVRDLAVAGSPVR
jgi:pimeloyl-ACP methyl ester carboxylesterase